MADAQVRLNATRIRAELNKLVKDVIALNNVQREQVKAVVRVDKAGRTYITTVNAMGQANKRFKETITTVNGELKSVVRTTDQAANRADKLAAATKRAAEQERKFAAEARKTTKSLQRQTLGSGGQTEALDTGITQGELFNFQNELGKLAELQKRHGLTSKQILAQWRTVAAGRVNAETGVARKVQEQLLRIRKAQQALGTDAAKAQDKARRATERTRKKLEEARNATRGFRLSWQNLIRITAISLGLRAINALIFRIREGILEAQKFSIAVAEIQTIDRAAVSTANWTAELRELSDSFGIDIVDQAEAAYQALSNQIVTGADATAFLIEANILAKTAVTDTSTAVKILTATLNAFDIGSERSNEVAAKLFKTVELGRLRLDEIADRFGRVAVPADQLGVSLDELNAAIATVTIRGVKAEEATTLLRNIFLKLIKPTEAMKDFLGELGFNSGQAAIETLGLEGVLIKLEERTQGSAGELAELFGRIRAITGAMIFAGEGVKDFGRNLDAISKSQDTFAQKLDIIQESAGDQLKRALNEIANIFKVDLGQASLEAIRDLTGGFTGLVTGAKALISIARALAVATIPALVAGMILLVINVRALTLALLRLSASNIFITILTAIGAAVAAIDFFIQKQRQAVQESIRAAQSEAAALQQTTLEEQKAFDKRLSNQDKFLTARRRAVFASTAEIIGAIGVETKAQIVAFESVAKVLKSEFKDLAKVAVEEASKAEKAFEKTEKKIKELRESNATAFESEGRSVFELKLEIAADADDPQKQLKLISERINELKRSSSETLNISLFEDLRKELLGLVKQRGQLLADNVKSGQQQQVVNAFAADLNRTLRESVALRQKLIALQDEQLAKDKERQDATKNIQKDLDAAIKAFNAFDAEDVSESTDPAVVTAAFEAQQLAIQEILDLEKELGTGTLDRLRLENLLTASRKENIEQVKRLQLQADVDAAKEAQRLLVENRNKAVEEQKKQTAFALTQQKRLLDFSIALRDPEGAGRRAFGASVAEETGTRGDVEAINEQFVKTADAIRDFAAALTTGDAQKIGDLGERAEVLVKQLSASGVNIADFNDASKSAIVALFGEAKRIGDIDKERSAIIQEQRKLLQLFTTEFDKFKIAASSQATVDAFVKRIGEGEAELAKIQGVQITTQEAINQALKDGEGNLADFNKALEDLTERLKQIERDRNNGTSTQELARGGFVKRFAGGGGFIPHGTDTVPAMLTPGEFVVNAAASKRFASQLVSMNSQITPRGFQNGGAVTTTNDSTFNITIQGVSNDPNELATQVAEAIQRQQRRGTVPSSN